VVASVGKGLAVTVYFGNMIYKNNAELRLQKLWKQLRFGFKNTALILDHF